MSKYALSISIVLATTAGLLASREFGGRLHEFACLGAKVVTAMSWGVAFFNCFDNIALKIDLGRIQYELKQTSLYFCFQNRNNTLRYDKNDSARYTRPSGPMRTKGASSRRIQTLPA